MRQNISFEEVVIRFTRQIYYGSEHTFQLEVRQSPGPLPGGAFQADIEARLEQFHRIFSQNVSISRFFYRYEISATEAGLSQELATLGSQLYGLLPESFRQAFPRLIQSVFEKGQGLHFVLEARAGDKADPLLSLPWEVLFFTETQLYLARSPRVLIVRRLLESLRRSPFRLELPFNITHVIADHITAPKKYRIDPNLQQIECETIPQAIAPGHYQLVEPPGSVEQMLDTLRTYPYHIVHFLGHGEIYRSNNTEIVRAYPGQGYLRFVSVTGESQWVTGEQLQHLLGFTPTVQLVVLNACHGGTAVAGNIALELVHSGLPYVVAMQSDILQEAAKYFIQAFYGELQSGQSIEYAVAVGRASIAAYMPQTIDWCLPVLYTNVGLPEKPLIVSTADNLWHWFSMPRAQKRLSTINIAVGLLHILVGLLLLLSHATPILPNTSLLGWVTGGLAIAPLLLTIVAYLLGQVSPPNHWSFSTFIALMLHSLGAASIGLGLPICYAGFILVLLTSLGFFSLLSSEAQLLLYGLIFAPGLLLSYSQVIGQSQAFITNAQVKLPIFCWDELVITAAGYILLLLPWVAFKFGSDMLASPWGNFIVGLLLLILGVFMHQADAEVNHYNR